MIRNALTVDVEDYFHVSAFADSIRPTDWDNHTLRVEHNTRQLLDLFEENPLPWVLLVTPLQADDAGLEETVGELAEWLEVQDRVDLVQVFDDRRECPRVVIENAVECRSFVDHECYDTFAAAQLKNLCGDSGWH